MATAGAHLSILMLTSYKSNLEAKITQIAERRQALSYSQAEKMNNYINAVPVLDSTKYQELMNSGNLAGALKLYQDYSASLQNAPDWTRDPEFKLLELKDNDFDMQQKKLETQLKAVVANLESQQKLLDGNIKQDFSPKLSI